MSKGHIIVCRYGLECLFRFYSYGLERKFRPDLYRDFQAETLKDCESGQLYGLEKFWAFMKYYSNAEELDVDPKLKTKLEPFNSIEDFKVLYPPVSSSSFLLSFIPIAYRRKNFHLLVKGQEIPARVQVTV